MIVVDAGALALALVDDGPDGERSRQRLAGEPLAAPELIDLEVVSVIRRLLARDAMATRRADQAVDDLVDLPMTRASHAPLVRRCLDLRENLTPYDAAYVAVAEALDVPLVTADPRLARAPGPRCTIEVI